MKALLVQVGRLRANAKIVQKLAGDASVYAVLKGNAYGMGLVETAKMLREEGFVRFALTELADAIALRSVMQDVEILMLRSTPEPEFINGLIDYNLVGTIGSQDAAVAMNGIAKVRGTVIEAHIEIDTGMGRYGFEPDDIKGLLQVYKYMDGLALTGIYTHFCESWKSEKRTRAQLDALNYTVSALHRENIDPGLVHAANSSALTLYPWSKCGAVRVGSMFTGRIAAKNKLGLQRVGAMISEVGEVRRLPAGSTVGYGSAYKAKKDRQIAVIPVGYADGFCVEKAHDSYRLRDALLYALSSLWRGLRRKKMYVTINGKRARVLGHVGMLHTVADVTGMRVSAGDRVLMDVNPILVPSEIKRLYE